MARLAFLGLGIMGRPMARNLMRAGHKVNLWSNTASKAEELAAAENGQAFATPAEAAHDAECIFLCVGNTAMSETVILGNEGLRAGAAPGAVIADASTISPADSRRISAELAASGLHYLDAPCTGSRPGAENGNLTFMVGGEQSIFDRVRPFFEPMGKKLYYCGTSGMGLHAKLTQNLILCNILNAFNEGLVLSTKAGVDPTLMLDILSNSAAKSGLIEYKAPFVLRRDFTTNFSVKWMHKDIGLMLDSGEDLRVPLPMTALTHQMFQSAISSGLEDADMCSTIQVLERITGVEVKIE